MATRASCRCPPPHSAAPRGRPPTPTLLHLPALHRRSSSASFPRVIYSLFFLAPILMTCAHVEMKAWCWELLRDAYASKQQGCAYTSFPWLSEQDTARSNIEGHPVEVSPSTTGTPFAAGPGEPTGGKGRSLSSRFSGEQRPETPQRAAMAGLRVCPPPMP